MTIAQKLLALLFSRNPLDDILDAALDALECYAEDVVRLYREPRECDWFSVEVPVVLTTRAQQRDWPYWIYGFT